jgi:hypothetical protein
MVEARMMLLLLGAALAGDPSPGRCEAVFLGPVAECSLSGSWAASGFGKNESQARKHAVERLERALAAGAEARAEKAADTPAAAEARAEVATCPKVAEDAARIHCYAEPPLVEKRLCFADFDDDACWRGEMQDMEGTAWKMMEAGRDLICKDLAAALSDAPKETQARCAAKCEQQARVRCPG